jgi:hypothetical protein
MSDPNTYQKIISALRNVIRSMDSKLHVPGRSDKQRNS